MAQHDINRRGILRLGFGTAASLAALPAFAQEAAEADAAARAVEVMAIGSEDAPVTVVEYASLTCPHCASFHNTVFDRIKANYIETGKVRFEVRDVYFDRYGLWAAMIARCGGAERYFGIVDLLYKRQPDWSRLEDPADAIGALYAIGRQAGLTNEQMESCVQDVDWAERLVAEYQKNVEADGVEGTPTFFINGEKSGNMSYAEFSASLDEALGS